MTEFFDGLGGVTRRCWVFVGLFLGFGVVWVVFGWCFWWFATRRGWLVFCRVLGVLVGGGFALLAGFVYVSSLLPRGAAGRRVPAGFPCGCGGGLRTQERVLCYFTSHLIASGATPPRRWARGCREALMSPCDVVVRHGCPSGRPCCLSFLSFV